MSAIFKIACIHIHTYTYIQTSTHSQTNINVIHIYIHKHVHTHTDSPDRHAHMRITDRQTDINTLIQVHAFTYANLCINPSKYYESIQLLNI